MLNTRSQSNEQAKRRIDAFCWAMFSYVQWIGLSPRLIAAFSAGSPKASQPMGCMTLKPFCTQYRAMTSPSA